MSDGWMLYENVRFPHWRMKARLATAEELAASEVPFAEAYVACNGYDFHRSDVFKKYWRPVTEETV